jgi:hypothetical protein
MSATLRPTIPQEEGAACAARPAVEVPACQGHGGQEQDQGQECLE